MEVWALDIMLNSENDRQDAPPALMHLHAACIDFGVQMVLAGPGSIKARVYHEAYPTAQTWRWSERERF
jgi:hypothetical protein